MIILLEKKKYVQEEYFCCDHPFSLSDGISISIQKASALIYSNPFFMGI